MKKHIQFRSAIYKKSEIKPPKNYYCEGILFEAFLNTIMLANNQRN